MLACRGWIAMRGVLFEGGGVARWETDGCLVGKGIRKGVGWCNVHSGGMVVALLEHWRFGLGKDALQGGI